MCLSFDTPPKINILPLPFYGSPRNPKHLWLPVRREPFNFANE